MRIDPSDRCRSYATEVRLTQAVKDLLAEDEHRVPWVAVRTQEGRWTAIVFLPSEYLARHMRNVAACGFKVCN